MAFLRTQAYYDQRFHPKQEDAWLAYKAGLDLVLDWGRRSGKSELIADAFVEDVEENGKDCMYCALTQTQAHEIMWPKFVKSIGEKTRTWKSNETRLTWTHKKTQAKISLKGFDLGADKLRGNAKRLIALDEWAFLRQKVKKRKGKAQLVAEPTLVKEVFAPQLVDYGGQLFYLSTPKGKNFFWKLKQRALADQLQAFRDPSHRRKFFTSHCTMFENPFLNEDGRARLISEYTGTDDPLYKQEVLALYIVLEGLAFALPQDSYTTKRWDPADFDHSFHWLGIDHGFSPDPTAAVWIAYNARKKHFLLYNEYRQTQMLIHQHADAIKGWEPYHVLDRLSDIDPQVMAEYDAVGLTLTAAGKHDKESRILRLVNALKTGRLKIAENCSMLLDEMSTYEWYQDGNDDLIDAMNYGYNNLTVPEEVPETLEEDPRLNPDNRSEAYGQSFGD